MTQKQFASKGGYGRAAKLSKRNLTRIGRKGAKARWGKRKNNN